MKAIWDPRKAESNLRKHGVRFSDAEFVLSDPLAISNEDEKSQVEQRFVAVGSDCQGRILVVAYTYRGGNVRLISARSATSKERRCYEAGV